MLSNYEKKNCEGVGGEIQTYSTQSHNGVHFEKLLAESVLDVFFFLTIYPDGSDLNTSSGS